jgi:hypothetical protein
VCRADTANSTCAPLPRHRPARRRAPAAHPSPLPDRGRPVRSPLTHRNVALRWDMRSCSASTRPLRPLATNRALAERERRSDFRGKGGWKEEARARDREGVVFGIERSGSATLRAAALLRAPRLFSSPPAFLLFSSCGAVMGRPSPLPISTAPPPLALFSSALLPRPIRRRASSCRTY